MHNWMGFLILMGGIGLITSFTWPCLGHKVKPRGPLKLARMSALAIMAGSLGVMNVPGMIFGLAILALVGLVNSLVRRREMRAHMAALDVATKLTGNVYTGADIERLPLREESRLFEIELLELLYAMESAKKDLG